MRRAVLLALLALPLPASAQKVDESLFAMQYLAARTAHLCGVTDAAEALRLSAAIAAYYAAPSDPRDGKPRIAPARLRAIRADLDKRVPSAKDCEPAPRYVPHLQKEYPPGGKIERNPPGSVAWDAKVRQITVVEVAAAALRCGTITRHEAAETIARVEALPILRFHWTHAEITGATRQQLDNPSRLRRGCDGIADLYTHSLEMLSADETGWQPAN
jgi:hypothetical protein